MSQLPKRKKYSVKDVLSDLKKIGATPTILSKIGSQLIYYEWTCCRTLLSDDHPVTSNLHALLEFMEHEYEQLLVSGELWRVKDTPQAAINDFLRGRSKEFLEYPLDRPADSIRELLVTASKNRKNEVKFYKNLTKLVKKEIKEDKKNPNLWNKLRLVLWMAEKYPESSEAFKTAKKFGWSPETSALVGI
jgi:superfamily II DNA helicase RecQ